MKTADTSSVEVGMYRQYFYSSLSILEIPPVVVLKMTRVLTFLLNKLFISTSVSPNWVMDNSSS